MEQKQQSFSTIGYIAAALGMCIGTGNVWRFPRICAANGGGAFILAWTIAMLIFAVPLLSAEMAIGKKTRLGTVGSFLSLIHIFPSAEKIDVDANGVISGLF